jgi:hypothetical protein
MITHITKAAVNVTMAHIGACDTKEPKRADEMIAVSHPRGDNAVDRAPWAVACCRND